jgi:hypothetical protein
MPRLPVQTQAEFAAWEATQIATRQAVLAGDLASLDLGAEARGGALTAITQEGTAPAGHAH